MLRRVLGNRRVMSREPDVSGRFTGALHPATTSTTAVAPSHSRHPVLDVDKLPRDVGTALHQMLNPNQERTVPEFYRPDLSPDWLD